MFILSDTLSSNSLAAQEILSGGRRFYRSRNSLTVRSFDWSSCNSIPVDTPFWDDMICNSARAGLAAARQSLKPAFFVWVLMAVVAVFYYAVPASRGFFAALSALQSKLGLLFPFLGMGLSVGILAEAVKVSISSERRWTRTNTSNALFNLGIFGVLGVIQNYFYLLQTGLFGSGTAWHVLLPKVLIDQFVWTVFFANPYQAILYIWKNQGFDWHKVAAQMRPFKPFWGTKILPVLITNWAFWIPMVAIIYCFPPELQLPLAILAVTIWVLLLSILTSKKQHEAP